MLCRPCARHGGNDDPIQSENAQLGSLSDRHNRSRAEGISLRIDGALLGDALASGVDRHPSRRFDAERARIWRRCELTVKWITLVFMSGRYLTLFVFRRRPQ
jgi:hypothetical protein